MALGLRPRTRTGSTAAGMQAPVHARFADRARRARRPRRRLWGWFAVVLGLVVTLVVTLWWSPVFVVEQVVVTGVDGDIADQASDNAALPLGRPLARVDTEAVGARVEQDLRIASAKISRAWPDTVTIEVALREPALLIDQDGARALQVADASGVIFTQSPQRLEGVPVISAPRGEIAAESLSGVGLMLAALPPELAEQVSWVRLTADGDLRFRMGSVSVEWGRPDQEQMKAQVVQAFLAQEQIDPDSERTVVLDIAIPQTPVVTGLLPADSP